MLSRPTKIPTIHVCITKSCERNRCCSILCPSYVLTPSSLHTELSRLGVGPLQTTVGRVEKVDKNFRTYGEIYEKTLSHPSPCEKKK